jgi:hypothetical protein
VTSLPPGPAVARFPLGRMRPERSGSSSLAGGVPGAERAADAGARREVTFEQRLSERTAGQVCENDETEAWVDVEDGRNERFLRACRERLDATCHDGGASGCIDLDDRASLRPACSYRVPATALVLQLLQVHRSADDRFHGLVHDFAAASADATICSRRGRQSDSK